MEKSKLFEKLNTKEKLELLKSGKITPTDNVKHFLKIIKEKNPKINAFLEVDEERVLREAKELESAKHKGKLYGLCIGVKAAINVLGYTTSCASNTLKNYRATYDADAIKKIKNEGGIIIGITNCDEFCCGGSGETSAFGPTQNPAAPGFIPGGSSSGSAAAVSGGMCDLALGSDTGGSIRNPASHCGVVGVKPRYGRVSRYGLVDLSMSLDQIGPLSPDVFGAGLLLSVIAGQSDNDGISLDEPVSDYMEFKKISNLKIGLVKEFQEMCSDKRIFEMIKKKSEQFAKKTNSELVNISLKHIELAVQTYYPLVYVEFFSGTRKLDGRRYGKKIEESCGEEVLRRILGGMEISKAEYQGKYYRKALAVKKIISDEFTKAFKDVNIIFSPTTPMLPHKIATKITDPKIMYAYDAYTIPANLAGICAGVVPAGKIDDAPVGIQMMAPDEKILLNVMRKIENE